MTRTKPCMAVPLAAAAAAWLSLATVAGATTMTEYFNGYGSSATNVVGLGTGTGGWAAAWTGTASSSYPQYVPAQQLSFSNPNYDNTANLSGPNDGLASGGVAGGIDSRSFSSGMTGTIWISALVQYASLSADVILWLDGAAANSNYVALRKSNSTSVEPIIKYNGAEDYSNNITFATGTTWLLIARIDMNVASTANDAVQFWVKGVGDDISSPAALGAPFYSKSGSDVFGPTYDRIGISCGQTNSYIDAIRVSNDSDAFRKVVAIPEPASLSLLAAGGIMLAAARRNRR